MIVRITSDGEEIRTPEPLTSILREKGIHFPLYCGGSGQCGKCLIQVREGVLPVTTADRQCLSEEQLNEGYRLGCQAVVEGNCMIELEAGIIEQDFYVPPSIVKNIESESGSRNRLTELNGYGDGRLGIAVDIGTTTIAMVLVNMNTGNICREYTGLNHQRSYGTDVMARIRASMEGKGAELQRIIRDDLSEGFRQLMEGTKASVECIVIAGNTTMMHLLRGYDCSGLGKYPFKPYSLGFEKMTLEELLRSFIGGLEHVPVFLMPGISAFIGGDITAGIWGCRIDKAEKPHLFLDLGTNAEMAIGCRGRILTTSAAAGPAFEGGQLSCGIGSIPGAVKDIKIQYGLVRYETIGRRPPVGICGTGMVAGMAAMLESGIMDSNGRLMSRYASSGLQIVPGKIRITQADIREFQKAKAAIRAGLDILVASSGYRLEDIAVFDLAGGFGCQLDTRRAAFIRLMPEALKDRVHPVGNAVINGLISYMMNPDEDGILQMIEGVHEFSLANHPDFTNNFLEFSRF